MNHFYDLIAPFLGIANAAFLALVLIYLLRGPFRRKYWIILAYVSWELFATAGLTIADVVWHGSQKMDPTIQTAANRLYARLYWSNDVLVDLFRFVLVIMLIYKATEGPRRVSGRFLTGLVLATMVLPFLLFHPILNPSTNPNTSAFFAASWFNSTSELLNFGAAIMNLFLWAALIASKNRDPQLLSVSAGLGVVVTGSAIALGIRYFLVSTASDAIGYFLMNLTQLVGWGMWCWTFRSSVKARPQFDGPVAAPKLGTSNS
jgi:hypothetical protein